MRLLEYRARFVQILNNSNYWLLGLAISLIGLHLQLYWRLSGSLNHISIELIAWSAVGYLLWQRGDRIRLKRETVSQFVGWFLVALLLVRGMNIRNADSMILETTSFVIGCAIALIAVGFKQFKDYQRELWIVFVLSLPTEFLIKATDAVFSTSLLTAKYAHALMWYLGFLVERQGTQLLMQTGAVDIYSGCSGLEAMIVTLKVAIFFLLVFPTRRKEKFLVPAIAILSAFIINGFRVMFLAYLVSAKDTAAFEYWHGSDGAQIFSMISMTIFSSYCQMLMERMKPNLAESTASPDSASEEIKQSSH